MRRLQQLLRFRIRLLWLSAWHRKTVWRLRWPLCLCVFCLSPTRAIIDCLKRRCASPKDEAILVQVWQLAFLLWALGICGLLGWLFPNGSDYLFARSPVWIVVLFALPISRTNEIAYAFARDALRQLRGRPARTPLAPDVRIRLAARSYVEVIFNLALVHYALAYSFPRKFYRPSLRSIGDALYFSTVTITTLGYGDIKPVDPFSRIVSMYEVLAGVALVALAVATYISGAPANTSARPATTRRKP
jgi:hypothetical protein